MGNLGATELLIIAVVVVLLFGSKKLPEMARSLGRSAKILKAETSGERQEDHETPPAVAHPVSQPQPATAVDTAEAARLQQQINELQQQLQDVRSQPPKPTS